MPQHPFDNSCVEADMVAKVFGGIWCLESDRNRRIWAALLRAVGIETASLQWCDARIQFWPYPRHHGADSGKEIGDVVFLAPEQMNVVIEVKRPGCRGNASHERQKIKRSLALSKEEGWPEPMFVCVVSEDCPIAGARLLSWRGVAEVFSDIDGPHSEIVRFIHSQVEVQDGAPGSDGSFGSFGTASAELSSVFPVIEDQKLLFRIARRYGLELQAKSTGGYVNLYGSRAEAQFHPTDQGIAIAIPDVGAHFPTPRSLQEVPLHSLKGHAQITCRRWLNGVGPYTSQPARAFLLPDIRLSDDHPAWEQTYEVLDRAIRRRF